MVRLLFVRHGETTSNVAGLLDTRIPGPWLTELGLRQAAAVPDALAGERIDAAVVSDMVRTSLTIAPTAARFGLEPEVRGGIREIASGDLEMRGDARSVRTYVETMIAWASGDLEQRMPGGESGHEFLARVDAVVEELERAGHDTVLLVSHGATIRTWCGYRAANLDGDFVAANHLDNTAIVVMSGSTASGWTCETWSGDPIAGPEYDGADGPTGEAVR